MAGSIYRFAMNFTVALLLTSVSVAGSAAENQIFIDHREHEFADRSRVESARCGNNVLELRIDQPAGSRPTRIVSISQDGQPMSPYVVEKLNGLVGGFHNIAFGYVICGGGMPNGYWIFMISGEDPNAGNQQRIFNVTIRDWKIESVRE